MAKIVTFGELMIRLQPAIQRPMPEQQPQQLNCHTIILMQAAAK